MLQVKVKKNNIEKALKILKRKVKDSGLMVELKEREYYIKPSEIKRRKRAEGRIREQRRSREINNY